jgi:hypothetical protein
MTVPSPVAPPEQPAVRKLTAPIAVRRIVPAR